MFKIELQWKDFNVSLPMIEEWVRANTTNTYDGASADYKLTLWFNSEISDNQKQAIIDYWDQIESDDLEATSYVSSEQIREAMNDLRAGLLSKSWDNMSVAERKLVLGQTPTNTELGLG